MVADPTLKTVTKALNVLTTLNQHSTLTVLELHKYTGISRPALYRILKTLCEYGFATEYSSGTFRQTKNVHSLSDNFREPDIIVETIRPIMDQLCSDVLWPVDLAIMEEGNLTLVHTTRSTSPIQVDRSRTGFRLPILWTALGRAYLAYCPREECRLILAALRVSRHFLDSKAEDQQFVQRIQRQTRKQGYGMRMGELPGFKHTGSIAVPLYVGTRLIATLGITFRCSAMEPDGVPDETIERLRDAADRCIADLAELGTGTAY